MKNYAFFSFIALALFFAGCGNSITITSDYDKQVDFTQFKTFGFLDWDEQSKSYVNDLDRRRIEDAVSKQLEARGFTRVPDTGETMIGFHVIVETKSGTTAYTNHYGGMGYYGAGGGFGYGYGYPYGGASTTTYQTYEYQIGTLIIDQFETKTRKLIWEGIAQGEIEEKKENREENLNKDMARMFADYPIKLPEAQ